MGADGCEASEVESVVPLRRQAAPERPSGDCPGDDTLLGFCAAALTPERSASFRRHLEACPACMDLVTGVINDWAPPEPAKLLEVGTNFRAGERVGPFALVRFVARGGMGEVYEARDEEGQRVALKAILAAACDHPQLVRAFYREAWLGRRVSHPNVCRIHAPRRGRATSSPVPFFTMDYLEGETLQARLRRGPLQVGDALAIAEQVLLGLSAIHDTALLHLDIKASNVMLAEHPARAVILDFGLARRAGAGVRARRLRPLAGSLPYMPPEQLLGEPPSRQNDIFALGVVLFQMLTAELPFPMSQPSTPSSIVERLTAPPQPPSALVAGVPGWLDRLVLGCLSGRAQRPRDTSAVLAAIAAR